MGDALGVWDVALKLEVDTEKLFGVSGKQHGSCELLFRDFSVGVLE